MAYNAFYYMCLELGVIASERSSGLVKIKIYFPLIERLTSAF